MVRHQLGPRVATHHVHGITSRRGSFISANCVAWRPPDTIWVQLVVAACGFWSPKVLSVQRSRSLVVEFPQRYGIFKGPVPMFSCFCVSCHGIRSCTFRLAISHECGLNHEAIEAVGHYRVDFTAS